MARGAKDAGMGLYRRGETDYWWCRFQHAGREVKRSTHTRDRRAAAAFERKLRAELEKASARRPRQRGRTTLARLGALDVQRAAGEGTTTAHQAALEWQWRQVCRHLGADTDPNTITEDTAERYIAARRGEGALGQTITREISRLWWGLTRAHKKGWLAFAPPPRPKVRRDPKGAKRTGRLHHPSVLSQWLAAMDPHARDAAELAVLTSLRATELRRVTAEWVQPAPDGASVPAVLRVPPASAKDREERVLPLVPRALEIIGRRAAELAEAGAPRDLPLFPGDHKRAFATARRAIGYATPISLRDLRHTWATLASRGVGVVAARDMLGHSTIATTDHYLTAGIDQTSTAALAIEGQLGRTAAGSESAQESRHRSQIGSDGAGNGARAHDPQLGKLSISEHQGRKDAAIPLADVLRAIGAPEEGADKVGTGRSAQVTSEDLIRLGATPLAVLAPDLDELTGATGEPGEVER